MTTGIKTILLKGSHFELLEPLTANVGPWPIVVPAGYVTDFASIPAVLHWWVRPTDSRAARAAVIHDWLYHTNTVPRSVADAVFQVILRQDGMPRCKAKLMSTAVRKFGKGSYMRGSSKLRMMCPQLAHHIQPIPDIE